MPSQTAGDVRRQRAEPDAWRRLGSAFGPRRPATLDAADEVVSVRADGDVAVEVRSKELGADLLEPRNGPRRRVPVGVARAGADHGDRRAKAIDERICGSRRAAVVGNFQDVDRATEPFGKSVGHKLRVDLLLDVAGKEHAALTELEVENDRHVVDARARVRRP
jgi:hypothetical protein